MTDTFDYEKKREIVRTPRTIIREIALSDLPALFRLYQEPGVTDYMAPLHEWEEEVEYTKTYIQMIYGFYGYGMWVVTDLETGELIGRVGFDDRTLPDGKNGSKRILELGFLITPKRQGQGHAEEVCCASIRYMQEEFEEDTFTCLIEPGNEASVRLVKKLGFSQEGTVLLDGTPKMEWTLRCESAQKQD